MPCVQIPKLIWGISHSKHHSWVVDPQTWFCKVLVLCIRVQEIVLHTINLPVGDVAWIQNVSHQLLCWTLSSLAGVLFLEVGSFRGWNLVNRSGSLGLQVLPCSLLPLKFCVSSLFCGLPHHQLCLPVAISRTEYYGLKSLELQDETNILPIPSPRLPDCFCWFWFLFFVDALSLSIQHTHGSHWCVFGASLLFMKSPFYPHFQKQYKWPCTFTITWEFFLLSFQHLKNLQYNFLF